MSQIPLEVTAEKHEPEPERYASVYITEYGKTGFITEQGEWIQSDTLVSLTDME